MGRGPTSLAEWREYALGLTGRNVGDWQDYLGLGPKIPNSSSDCYTRHYQHRRELPAPVQKQTPIVSRRNVKVSKKKTLYMLCYTVKPMMVWVVSYWSALEIFNLVNKLKLLLGLTYKWMKMWSYP